MTTRALYWPAAALFAVLFGYPVARLFVEGIAHAVDFPWWRDPFLWRLVAFTYGQALVSAVLSALVGIPGAVLYAEERFRGRGLFWRLSLVSFSLPVLLVALSFAALGGRAIFGWPAILLVHVFFNYPLFTRQVGTALATMDRSPEKAALSLGASRAACFCRVTLPRLAPEIGSAFVLSFLFCSMTFLVPLLLGGGPRFTTVEVAIYQAVKVDFDPALAARLAALPLVVGLLAHALLRRARRGAAVAERGAFTPIFRFRSERANLAARLAYFAGLALLVGAPLASLVVSGLPALRSVGVFLGPLWTSLRLAGLTTAVAVPVAFGLAYAARRGRRLPELLAGLPLSVSALVLMLGLARAFPAAAGLGDSLLPIAFVQAMVALPLVYRPLRDGLGRIPDAVTREAASLGATEAQRLVLVELPLLARPLALATLLAATYSLGEVAAVLLFAGGGVETLPLAIFRAMARYRFDEAYAGGLLLLVVTGLGQWLGTGEER